MNYHYQMLWEISPPLQEGEKVYVLDCDKEILLTVRRYPHGLIATNGDFRQTIRTSSQPRYRREGPSAEIKMEDFL